MIITINTVYSFGDLEHQMPTKMPVIKKTSKKHHTISYQVLSELQNTTLTLKRAAAHMFKGQSNHPFMSFFCILIGLQKSAEAKRECQNLFEIKSSNSCEVFDLEWIGQDAPVKQGNQPVWSVSTPFGRGLKNIIFPKSLQSLTFSHLEKKTENIPAKSLSLLFCFAVPLNPIPEKNFPQATISIIPCGTWSFRKAWNISPLALNLGTSGVKLAIEVFLLTAFFVGFWNLLGAIDDRVRLSIAMKSRRYLLDDGLFWWCWFVGSLPGFIWFLDVFGLFNGFQSLVSWNEMGLAKVLGIDCPEAM